RVRAAGAAGLIAKGEAVVAVARGNVAVRVTGKVQAARRDGEIGAQAQLLAVGIDEDVSAGAQRLADGVEEGAGGLDDGRGDLLVAGAREHPEQRVRLSVGGARLPGGYERHGPASPLAEVRADRACAAPQVLADARGRDRSARGLQLQDLSMERCIEVRCSRSTRM